MKYVKYGSKKAVSLAQNYWNSYKRTLSDCYGRHSNAKEKAYFWCLDKMAEYNGYDFRICTHNSQTFTAAFRFMENDTEYLFYMTAYNDYKIRLI